MVVTSNGVPLFDRNIRSCFGLQIDRGIGRGHVEGNPVGFGQHCDRVGPDLIGHIPICRDAISPHDTEMNALPAA